MSSESRTPLPFVLLLKFLLNVGLVWLLSVKFSQYFVLTGDFGSIVVIGSLLTLLNLFVRPFLNAITLPLRFFATLLALVIVNGIFLFATLRITGMMDPEVLTLSISGGIIGWIVVALVLGTGNWVMKLLIQ
jgi:uncharacterized membrane protein YvlD (DUF360 family)